MELTQSTAFNYPVLMISNLDHITGKTGLVLTVTLAKNGGSFQSISPVIVEQGFGWYTIVLTEADTDTIGALALHISSVGADPFDALDEVVSAARDQLVNDQTVTLLNAAKTALDIELTDTTQDLNLLRLLRFARTWVENETHRYFGPPKLETEYRNGSGERSFTLIGHVYDDPSFQLRVFRRPLWEASRAWEELIEGDDWERREQTLFFLQAWSVWATCDEFKIEFLSGYAVLPDDIQELIVEIAVDKYLTNEAIASGTGGVTSERIGDFSYTVDLKFVIAGTGKLNDFGYATLNHYKRLLV